MKKFLGLFIVFFSLSFLVNISIAQFAQLPTYNLRAMNFVLNHPMDDELEFDIYLEHTNVSVSGQFYYALGQYYFSFNPAIATNIADLQYTIIGSDIPQHMWPRNPAINIAANPKAYVLSLQANAVLGNGYIFPNVGFPGIKIVRMRLKRLSGAFNNQYFSLAWRNLPIATFRTRIYAYVGTTSTEATTPSTHSIDTSGLGGVLPVELTSFSSSSDKNNLTLIWQTSKEINNSGFEIERLDTKGQTPDNWRKIGFVPGNGSTGELRTYKFSEKLNTGKYKYRLRQIDYNGNFQYFYLTDEVTVGIPDKYNISQNYPNPFNPTTKIDYDLPYDGKVSIILYNVTGREVANLVNEFKIAGYNTIQFNASNLSSGIYFYRIVVSQSNSNSAEENKNVFTTTKKMTVLK